MKTRLFQRTHRLSQSRLQSRDARARRPLFIFIAYLTASIQCLGQSEPLEVKAEDLFRQDAVLDIEIEIKHEDWDVLRKQSRQFGKALSPERKTGAVDEPFDYFKGDIRINGARFAEVGVRKKGFLGSLDEFRPSLKIKFDEYIEGQALDGVENMTLNNNKQDPSRLHQFLAYKIFADAGLPAPRCNFARVRVNGEDLGIYTHVEPIKKPFLRRYFNDASGNLYEGTIVDFFEGWARAFEFKNNDPERDDAVIERIIQALERDDEQTVEELEACVDMDSFIDFWAVEVLLGHWDGYAGNRNNFYFYQNPETDKLHFIPWGADQIAQLQSPFWQFTPPQSVLANGRLCNYLYEVPRYREKYRERLRFLLDTVWKESELIDQLDRMEALIQKHETSKPRGYAGHRRKLVQFIENRRQEIMPELEAKAPEWEFLPQEPSVTHESGTVELDFETTWNPATANPGIVPSASKMRLDLPGEEHRFVAVTAGAGPGDSPPMIGAPTIVLMGRESNGTSYIASLALPMDNYAAGKGSEAAFGALLKMKGFMNFEFAGMLFGEVDLKEAGQEAGAAVSGSAKLKLLSFPNFEMKRK